MLSSPGCNVVHLPPEGCSVVNTLVVVHSALCAIKEVKIRDYSTSGLVGLRAVMPQYKLA